MKQGKKYAGLRFTGMQTTPEFTSTPKAFLSCGHAQKQTKQGGHTWVGFRVRVRLREAVRSMASTVFRMEYLARILA